MFGALRREHSNDKRSSSLMLSFTNWLVSTKGLEWWMTHSAQDMFTFPGQQRLYRPPSRVFLFVLNCFCNVHRFTSLRLVFVLYHTKFQWSKFRQWLSAFFSCLFGAYNHHQIQIHRYISNSGVHYESCQLNRIIIFRRYLPLDTKKHSKLYWRYCFYILMDLPTT